MLFSIYAPMVFSIVGIYTYKINTKNFIKYVLDNEISDTKDFNFQILVFTQEELGKDVHWENEKEFSYKSEMYDVVKVETIENLYYYTCYKDYKETHLKHGLLAFFKKLSSKKRSSRGIQKVNFNKLYTFNKKNGLSADFYSELNRKINSYYFFRPFLLNNPPPSPPPEFHFFS